MATHDGATVVCHNPNQNLGTLNVTVTLTGPDGAAVDCNVSASSGGGQNYTADCSRKLQPNTTYTAQCSEKASVDMTRVPAANDKDFTT